MNASSKYLKEFYLCSIFVILHTFMCWMWYWVMPAIIAGDFRHYQAFILPIVMLGITAVLFSLAALLVKHRGLFACSMVIAGLSPYLLSLPSDSIAWVVSIATVLFLWYGASLIRKEVESSLQYRTSRFLKQGLGFYFTSAALVFSLFYLHSIDDQKVFSVLLPRPLFDLVLRSFSGAIQGATGLPKIQPEQTVNEVLTEIVQAQLQSRGMSIEKIPRQELTRMLAVQREEFANAYHISLAGGEKVGAVFANAVTSKIKDLVGKYNSYLPLVAAIAFFFAVKTFSIILYFLSIALTVLLMKLLVLANVVQKRIEQIDVERFTL